MHTGPPPKEAHMLTTLTTQPKVMLKRMSPEEIQETHQLSLKQDPLPYLKYHRDIQVCSALLTLFYLQGHIFT